MKDCRLGSLSFVLLFGGVLFFTVAAQTAGAAEEPWVAPARAAKKKNPVATSPESVAAGNKVYVANCLSCHGTTGKGDGPAAKDLAPKKPGNLSDPKIWEQTDGTIYWKVTEGKAPMPTFEKLITEEDRWNLVNFVRTLAPKP